MIECFRDKSIGLSKEVAPHLHILHPATSSPGCFFGFLWTQFRENKINVERTIILKKVDISGVQSMRIIGKSILIILVAAILLPALAAEVGNVEYRPAEKAAENLLNKGIGGPWVGGDPFGSNQGADHGHAYGLLNPSPIYRIIGYLDVTTGLIIAADGGKSLQLKPGPGKYPVYGYFSGNKLVGLFIDFSSSG
jgi:hypothetical protein